MTKSKTKTRKAKKPLGKPPKGAMLMRTSERSTFNRCRWQWGRIYGEGLKPIQEHPALRFGSLIHEALEVRYPVGIKRGPHPAQTFEKLYAADLKKNEQEWGMFADEEWTDALELGIDMLNGYVDKYGRDEQWEVLASEMKFAVPVYMTDEMAIDNVMLVAALYQAGVLTEKQVQGKEPLFWYVGTMDGVWKDRSSARVRINDYKTTSGDAVKEGEAKGVLDEQATAYWTFGVDYLIAKALMKARVIEALDGMLYTFLKKSKKDDRPVNDSGYALNKPKKDAVMAYYEEEGIALPTAGTGKNGNVVLDDLIANLGDAALTLGEVSKDQPAKRFHREIVYRGQADRENARARVVEEFLEMECVKANLMPYRKTPGSSYPTLQCKGCSVRDLCEIHEAGQDWQEAKELTMIPWDPYSAHEIVEEGKGS
jgi:hypothetical protein